MHILCTILCIGAPSVRCHQKFDTVGAVLTFWYFDTTPMATLVIAVHFNFHVMTNWLSLFSYDGKLNNAMMNHE